MKRKTKIIEIIGFKYGSDSKEIKEKERIYGILKDIDEMIDEHLREN